MANKTTGQTIGVVVGGTIGFAIGGPKGALIGASIGYAVGTMIDPPGSDTGDMPPMASYPVQRSNKGTPIPKIYGTARVAGNILWMGENHPWQHKSSSGGKGGGGGETVTDSGNRRSFLIGICEGPAIVLRVWKGKTELTSLNGITVFRGEGEADTGINALTGEEFSNYPNTCCVYFDEFEIGSGGALPNFTFEVTSKFDPTKTQIISPTELQAMNDDLNGDYELLADIDMTGFDFDPIGTLAAKFTGTFEGNYHTISNLTIDFPELPAVNGAGLFAGLDSATVQNLLLEDVDIHAHTHVGGLAGTAEGTTIIHRVGVTGGLFADKDVVFPDGGYGGLLGGMAGTNVSITECWANVNITFNYGGFQDGTIGGLLGAVADKSTVTDCWAGGNMILGDAPATNYPWQGGGFAGNANQPNGQITRCLSYCDILTTGRQTGGGDTDVSERIGGFLGMWSAGGPPIDSHWDTDVSGVTWHARGKGPPADAAEAGILGHTTVIMRQQSTYANWDFDNIWQIDEGNGYPTLRWVNIATVASDENPAVIMKDLLTNDRYGAGIDESTYINTASFTAAEEFCDANGLRFSFAIDKLRPVLDWIDFINSHFQGYLYFSEGKISLGILKEETSVFTITRDNLVIEEGENPDPPVQIEKRVTSETANRIEVTWRNRGKNYDTSVAIAMDEVDQRVTGKVRKKTIQLIGITNKDLAQKTAYRLLFESMYRFSTYNFILSYQNMLLEVGDVGTLSDGFLLTNEKIRITSIEEDKDGRGIAVQAIEDTAYIYEQFEFLTQDSERVEDGPPDLEDAQAVFTESLDDKGFIISIAPGGVDTNGWQIYKSFDDTTYEFVGQANIDEPDDGVTNSVGTTLSSLPSHKTGSVYAGEEEIIVDIGIITVLDTAITDDLFFNNKRLCKIGNEIIAYKTCVQTSIAGQWKITGLIRGLFGTEAVAHTLGETFWTINIDFNFGYADSDIGKIIYFKFLTLHGSSIQSLSDVSGIPYVVQGEAKRPLPVSLMRIRDREGLITYKTDDVVIDFYFSSKTAGFNVGGFGSVGWGIYIMDPALIALNILLEEEDGTDILEQRFLLSEYFGEPALDILLADRNGKNPIVVNMTPESELVSNQTRNITITNI